MKKYKPNYMFTIMFQLCNLFLSFFPGFVIMWICLNPEEAASALYVIPLYIVLILCFVVLGNVFHFIICLFTKHRVYIDETSVTVKGKRIMEQTMKLEDVSLVTFDQGMITRYGGGTPCSLNLFNADRSESIRISNPSFFMILNVQKRCKRAGFKFENYKWYIFSSIVFTAFAVALCILLP